MIDFQIGDVRVYRIEEWSGPLGPPSQLFPAFDPDVWCTCEPHFTPDYFSEGFCLSYLQSWLIKTSERLILFDTGVGNGKNRPNLPFLTDLSTRYLENFRDTGFDPDDVAIVINSHLHIDHVGWNTMADGDHWVPSFPNARYLLPAVDRDYWDPANWPAAMPRCAENNREVFEDSVRPILDAGMADLVGDGYQVAPGLTLRSAPGHTPGQMILDVVSQGEAALFIGDVIHHPVQVYNPDWSTIFCEDPAEAARTRHRVLAMAADRGARLVPAHFAGLHWAWVNRDGDTYRCAYDPTTA